MTQPIPKIYLEDFKPRSLLDRPAHIPERARFPVIDAHNHFWGDLRPEELLAVMDQVGIRTYCNLTANAEFYFTDEGYGVRRAEFRKFKERVLDRYPGRFFGFTLSEFNRMYEGLPFDDCFVEQAIAQLEADAALGARGLKITKELGLAFRDAQGQLIAIDDARLDPLWRRAGELGLPVLIHTSDPAAFFLPLDETNEHYQTLARFPGWHFKDSPFAKQELLDQRERVVARHPRTTFICPHVANYPERLDYVARLLDAYPNMQIDFSARIDELGRQPYTTRDFFIRYQDRILFGIDMPPSVEVYRCHFRFIETTDEYFDYPDYTGGWSYCRWKIHGLHLPDEVLAKVYYQNALKVIPGLEDISCSA